MKGAVAGRLPPIVALTADAVGGDREHRLAYWRRQFRRRSEVMLEKWVVRATQTAMEEPSWRQGEDAASDRLQELLDCGLTSDEAVELIDTFLTDSAKSMQELRVDEKQTDALELARIAHRLAGSSGNMGLSSLERTVRQLETSCKLGDMDRGKELLPAVADEYVRGRESLLRLRAKLSASLVE